MLMPLSLWLLVPQACPAAAGRPGVVAGRRRLGRRAPLAALAALAAMGAYMLVVFGFYSRLLESQADLFACRVPATGPSPEPRSSRPWRSWPSPRAAAGREAGSTPASPGAWNSCNRSRRDEKGELRFHRQVRLLGCVVVGLCRQPAVGPC